jgi:hypothetical protein
LLPARLAAPDGSERDQTDEDQSFHLIHLLLFGFRLSSLSGFPLQVPARLPASLAAPRGTERHHQTDQDQSFHRTPRIVWVRFDFPFPFPSSLSLPVLCLSSGRAKCNAAGGIDY